MSRFAVAAFYQFASLPQFAALQEPVRALCAAHGVKGIVLLAPEGINGTLAGLAEGLAQVMDGIRAITGLAALEHKSSHAETMPFLRLKVRLKREIVTMGEAIADPLRKTGAYVEARDWNALISDLDVLLIDTRNSFEHRVGTFKGAIDPGTTTFGEFPTFVRDRLDPAKHRKVAMFCTGGIRCEKASSLMLAEGFDEVYHLKGGILAYLEQVAPQDSLWEGGCFVFDERVALGHGLAVQPVQLCLNCSAVIDRAALQSPLFEEGVSCPACAAALTLAQKASARERHRQISLNKARGRAHMGPQDARPGTSRPPG
jgi:UPF0176 protein